LTSSLTFGCWVEVLGNHIIADAMIDRIAHYVEMGTLKEHSPRLKDVITQLPNEIPENKAHSETRAYFFIAGKWLTSR
jgi:hypothetical protein